MPTTSKYTIQAWAESLVMWELLRIPRGELCQRQLDDLPLTDWYPEKTPSKTIIYFLYSCVIQLEFRVLSESQWWYDLSGVTFLSLVSVVLFIVAGHLWYVLSTASSKHMAQDSVNGSRVPYRNTNQNWLEMPSLPNKDGYEKKTKKNKP